MIKIDGDDIEIIGGRLDILYDLVRIMKILKDEGIIKSKEELRTYTDCVFKSPEELKKQADYMRALVQEFGLEEDYKQFCRDNSKYFGADEWNER